MCCATDRDVTERSVTAMRTIYLSSSEVAHLGGCDRPRRSVVPSCIQRSHIRITVAWFRPTRLPISLKDNPQSHGRPLSFLCRTRILGQKLIGVFYETILNIFFEKTTRKTQLPNLKSSKSPSL
ncbi:uncharacterized protein TNCV_3670881 [Trichonephila clavipes]|nr:uncharacterized protein TNCV_3670881 [Trichonephila clavipes]